MEGRIEERRKTFKKAVDPIDARRKREDMNMQLRKQTKDEQMMKRRQIANTAESEQIVSAPAVADSRLSEAIFGVNTDDQEKQLVCTQQIRKLLSVEKDPPIQQVIDSGVIPRLIAFLSVKERADLQFEAAWALTNVASGSPEQTAAVINNGAVPLFVGLLSSPNADVQEQAVWALGNIAGDSVACRDLVLSNGIMQPLLHLIQTTSSSSLTKNATWTLSNLCRGKPQPAFHIVVSALDTLAALLRSSDVETLTDACWAFSYFSDGPNQNIDAVIKAGVASRLVELLEHPSPLVQTPALRCVGNIVTGDDKQTQVILECNVLSHLVNLLSSPKKVTRKETCWTISNITAGNQSQIQAVLNSGMMKHIIELAKATDFDVRKEASWAFCNAISGGSDAQVKELLGMGVLEVVCELLSLTDSRMVKLALETLEVILRFGESVKKQQSLEQNPVVERMEELDAIAKVESLQEDKNDDIYNHAARLLTSYFDLEDEGADPLPNVSTSAFQQGANVALAPTGGFNFAH